MAGHSLFLTGLSPWTLAPSLSGCEIAEGNRHLRKRKPRVRRPHRRIPFQELGQEGGSRPSCEDPVAARLFMQRAHSAVLNQTIERWLGRSLTPRKNANGFFAFLIVTASPGNEMEGGPLPGGRDSSQCHLLLGSDQRRSPWATTAPRRPGLGGTGSK